MLGTGHKILALEQAQLTYVVPRFEEAALSHLPHFRAIPWRRANLLQLRKPTGSTEFPAPAVKKSDVQIFTRRAQEFRVFMTSKQSLDHAVVLEILDSYSNNVSTRAHLGESPDLWTSEKIGVKLGQPDAVRAALQIWQEPRNRTAEGAIAELSETVGRDVAANVVRILDDKLSLWSSFATPPPLRTDEEIEQAKTESLSPWATKASARQHGSDSEIFRPEYQRDRDRILWSASFRRLAHKTQLFPTTHDDQLRQRLTHSIEVMQLASTIGASFGLDQDLIEAGALAHDIGHTPFGHAGEHALDKLLHEISRELNGFNHYEHGVDVIRWLEGPYAVSTVTPFHGLNLTPEVAECILKHTYCQRGEGLSAEGILRKSKNVGFIKGGYCHLEGQAVRIGDKVSYLVSDLEDGIRLGAITLNDLQGCRFFHRPPIALQERPDHSLYDVFLAQRRNILKVLMEDVLIATSKRLSRVTSSDIRTADGYTIRFSFTWCGSESVDLRAPSSCGLGSGEEEGRERQLLGTH